MENTSKVYSDLTVEIIDILDNGDYVYKSNLLDRTFNVGIISKVE